MNESLDNISCLSVEMYDEHRDLSRRLSRAQSHYANTQLEYLDKKWDVQGRTFWIPRAVRKEFRQTRERLEAGRLLLNTIRFEMEIQQAEAADFASKYGAELFEIAVVDAQNSGVEISSTDQRYPLGALK